jgi:putative oxidoreductase
MKIITVAYHRLVTLLSTSPVEAVALLFVRISLAGVFWRSGRTKVDEGSWLSVSDTAKFLFKEEYKGVPLPADFAAYVATYAEHVFPLLLVIGLFTRLSALALLGMTLVIQIFVYPEAWWSAHIIWVALTLVLIARGGGKVSLDTLLTRGQ